MRRQPTRVTWIEQGPTAQDLDRPVPAVSTDRGRIDRRGFAQQPAGPPGIGVRGFAADGRTGWFVIGAADGITIQISRPTETS